MPDINGADDTSLRDALAASLEGRAAPEPQAPVEPAAAPAVAPDRPRDDQGRFAAREAEQRAEAAAQPQQKTIQAPAGQPPVGGDGKGEAAGAGGEGDKPSSPPPGFSPTTKAAWNKPEWSAQDVASLKRDIAKRETEIEKGFAKFKDYKDLDPFVEMARNSGTTLTDAVKRYVEAETFLEKEPIKGLLWLCQNYGVDPRQLAQAVGGTPQAPQPGAPPNGNGAQPSGQPQQFDIRPHLQPIMAPIMQELNALRGIVYGDKQQQTQQTVATFFADPANKFAENVADQMADMIRSGQATDLKDAYDKACWMNPEIRGLLINDQNAKAAADQKAKAKQAADQARAAGRSITGGLGAAAPAANSDNLRATLEDAFASAARV